MTDQNKAETLALLAEYGIVGSDASTAYDAYLKFPEGADGIRVARVLEVAAL